MASALPIADAPTTLRAYATDLANDRTWCDRHGFQPMPATPEVVGAYLAAAGEGYVLPKLRRRVAAIARACGVAGQPWDTKHPAIRETLRGIGRKHGAPARRAAALTTAEVKRLCRICPKRVRHGRVTECGACFCLYGFGSADGNRMPRPGGVRLRNRRPTALIYVRSRQRSKQL